MKKAFSILLFAAMIITMIPFTFTAASAAWDGTTVAGAYESGDGTVGSPFIIKDGTQLAFLAAECNSGKTYDGVYFKLAADIDLGGAEWTPIALYSSTQPDFEFRGNFDGDGHRIYNYKITKSDSARAGLFGIIAGGTVSNLTIAQVTLDLPAAAAVYYGNVGGTIKSNIVDTVITKSVITNVTVESTVTYNTAEGTSAMRLGGIAGYLLSADVFYCDVYAGTNETNQLRQHSNSAFTGGIVGLAAGDSTIKDCVNYGNLTACSTFVGGIVGSLGASGATNAVTIENCANLGNIHCSYDHANKYVGGIAARIGQNAGTYNFTNCVSTGTVTAANVDAKVGAFAGQIKFHASITDCFAVGTVSFNNIASGALVNNVGISDNNATLTIEELTAAICKPKADLTAKTDSIAAGIAAYRASLVPATPDSTDAPGTDAPGTDAPGTDAPGTDAPGGDNPSTGISDTHLVVVILVAIAAAAVLAVAIIPERSKSRR